MYKKSTVLTKCIRHQLRSSDLKEKHLSGCVGLYLEKVTFSWLYNFNNEWTEADAFSDPHGICQFVRLL